MIFNNFLEKTWCLEWTIICPLPITFKVKVRVKFVDHCCCNKILVCSVKCVSSGSTSSRVHHGTGSDCLFDFQTMKWTFSQWANKLFIHSLVRSFMSLRRRRNKQVIWFGDEIWVKKKKSLIFWKKALFLFNRRRRRDCCCHSSWKCFKLRCDQCDQTARLFVHYLSINSENWPICIK